MSSLRRQGLSVAVLSLVVTVIGWSGAVRGDFLPFGYPAVLQANAWRSFARDAQHSANASVATQPLMRIHWRIPVDLAPQYSGGELLTHYGTPVITSANTVIVPIKRTAAGAFKVRAFNAATGSFIWQANSDYILPSHNWIPSFNPAMTPGKRLYFPGSGGKVFFRDDPDSAAGTVKIAVFYGLAVYNAAKKTYDADVMIDTPITTDTSGNIFFGFNANGLPNLKSGIARIGANGQGSWVAATAAAGDSGITHIAMNSAPALSPDQRTLYIAVSGGYYSNLGYLVALDSSTLRTKSKTALIDPKSLQPATITDDSTASPTVGPDGDVYYGVLETSLGAHNDRGWLLHFDAALNQVKTPGSFGWDDTVSLVPVAAVPSYAGRSSYLLMTKYNNYAGIGTGNGHNEIAILDPNATEADPVSGNPVMKEVLTIAGVTPDPSHPGGVREWCINSAVVDPFTKSVLANSEDGYLYRWDLATNAFTQRIALTSGIAESYTPTSAGPDGQVYAINNAVLFALGH